MRAWSKITNEHQQIPFKASRYAIPFKLQHLFSSLLVSNGLNNKGGKGKCWKKSFQNLGKFLFDQTWHIYTSCTVYYARLYCSMKSIDMYIWMNGFDSAMHRCICPWAHCDWLSQIVNQSIYFQKKIFAFLSIFWSWIN